MIKTIASRATFYDVIGYLIPGCISLIVMWLWFFIFSYESATWFVRVLLKHGVATTLCVIPLGYVIGHLVNSISSVLFEKWLFKSEFQKAKQWYNRVLEKCPARAERIQENVKIEFGIGAKPELLTVFDIRIRMEERMPNATITGFSFLSFYGMSRTLAFLTFLTAVPIGVWCFEMCYCFCCGFVIGVIGFLLVVLAGLAFIHQYLRFVEYYYDFLGSTLMFRT